MTTEGKIGGSKAARFEHVQTLVVGTSFISQTNSYFTAEAMKTATTELLVMMVHLFVHLMLEVLLSHPKFYVTHPKG